jgi:hypothetical protein
VTARRRGAGIAAAAQRSAPSTPAPGATAIRTKPVRITTDLDPGLWTDLDQWISHERARQRRQLSQADVIRALVSALVEDGPVVAAVRKRLSQ